MAISRITYLYFLFVYFLKGIIMSNNQQSFMDKLGDTIIDSFARAFGIQTSRVKPRNIRRVKISKKHSTLPIEVATALNCRISQLRDMGIDPSEVDRVTTKYTEFISRLSVYVREQRTGKTCRDTWLFYDDLITSTDVFELQETDVDSSVTNASFAVWL